MKIRISTLTLSLIFVIITLVSTYSSGVIPKCVKNCMIVDDYYSTVKKIKGSSELDSIESELNVAYEFVDSINLNEWKSEIEDALQGVSYLKGLKNSNSTRFMSELLAFQNVLARKNAFDYENRPELFIAMGTPLISGYIDFSFYIIFAIIVLGYIVDLSVEHYFILLEIKIPIHIKKKISD